MVGVTISPAPDKPKANAFDLEIILPPMALAILTMQHPYWENANEYGANVSIGGFCYKRKVNYA
jgi:hypothetical protein